MKKFFITLGWIAAMLTAISCNKVSSDDSRLGAIVLDETQLNLFVGDSHQLNATLLPESFKGTVTLIWSSSDEKVATVSQGQIRAIAKGKATITASDKDGRVTAECKVSVRNHCPEGAVDMGLDVYWATCNLCESGFVSSPEKFGDFFAWGETKAKTDYSESKYTYQDHPNTLPPAADAAHVILGAGWRMPTLEDCYALFDNCTLLWKTSQAGVTGGLFTSKITGNSIFLPAAGQQWGTRIDERGNYGYYRSSTISDYFLNSYSIWLVSWTGMRDSGNSRHTGQSIRPVSE